MILTLLFFIKQSSTSSLCFQLLKLHKNASDLNPFFSLTSQTLIRWIHWIHILWWTKQRNSNHFLGKLVGSYNQIRAKEMHVSMMVRKWIVMTTAAMGMFALAVATVNAGRCLTTRMVRADTMDLCPNQMVSFLRWENQLEMVNLRTAATIPIIVSWLHFPIWLSLNGHAPVIKENTSRMKSHGVLWFVVWSCPWMVQGFFF